MSILETPRIYFTGQMTWDPIVTNNYAEFYNEDTADPAPPGDPVADFRKRAIAAVDPRNWNPHGTHRSTFLAEISGVDTGGGRDTSDPFVGAPANFLGMLVDAEPYGTFSSQLFFDSMQFGIAGGYRVACPRRWRAMSRYINFNRNSWNTVKAGIASTIWQTSIPKDCGLQLDPHDSPALQALAEALADDDVLGLTVRWNTYRTIYYDDPTIRTNSGGQLSIDAQALICKLNIPNSFQPNPARSELVGVIGLWRAGEPACEPGDRALLATLPNEVVATAFARVTGDVLAIDLGNSVSEVDAQLTKQDLGTLTVCAMSPDGASVVEELGTLGYSSYDRCAYLATSGIVELPLSPEAATLAAGAPLQVRAGSAVYLAEEVLRAAPETQQIIYLDQGGDCVQATLQVLSFGEPAGAGVTVSRYIWDSGDNSATLVDSAQTGADGVASFEVAPAGEGAVVQYVFTAGADAAAPDFDPLLTPYIYVRTLPADADIGAMEATWDNVYGFVLSKWKAMAPCMDNWLDLADPAQVHAYGAVLKKLTDRGNFELYRYMPVTRDMTDGERKLLWSFLDAPLEGAARPAVLTAEAGPRANRPRRDIQALSRLARS
ncbi:MAG TPA: hypothetical protein VD846_14415 [Allosphingosinicella sp.]|nr:hypothetical protein [Allosphingosinicella sp.]